MKFASVVGIFFIVFSSSRHISASGHSLGIDGRFSDNAVTYQLFEMFRSLLRLGDLEKNIPIMDPYTFNTERLQIHNLIDVELNTTNAMISGLSNFKLESFALMKEQLALDITVKIPRVRFEADYYEMEGDIFQAFPIAGSGILYFLVKDVEVTSKLHLKQSDDGKSVVIDRLENTSFAIEKIVSRTQYDKNIDDVLNAMTEDLLAGYLTRFSRYIVNAYRDIFVIALNSIFNRYDTWPILATILH